MGGATFALPERDRTIFTKRYCMALLQVCFGGRVAEEIFCDDISNGAQSDIQQATRIARQMVLAWGMSSKLGCISYEQDWSARNQVFPMPGERDYSEKTAEAIDSEVKKITDEAYENAKKLIEANKDRLERIATALLKYETLDADDVDMILQGKEVDKPTVNDLLAAEQAKDEQAKAKGKPQHEKPSE